MEIKINENIYYKSFKSQKELKNLILTMIVESKIDRVLYKGEPTEINYKLLKKIIVPKETLKSTIIINPDDVKKTYTTLIQDTMGEPYCVIYKK